MHRSAAPRRPRRITLLLLAGMATLAAACGARWTDEQLEAQDARPEAAAEATASRPGTIVEGSVDEAATGTTAAGTSGRPAAQQTAGGEGGPDGAPAAGGQRPCRAPSDAPGVSDEEIAVGSISSLSGPVPGLGASSAAAARAYVEHKNANGGVCGRRLVLLEADDGTDVGRYRATVTSLSTKVLGIVGGFALGDVGGAEVVRQAGLPMVNVPSGDTMSAVPSAFDINPPFERLDVAIGKYRFLREQGASTAALVYLAVDQSRAEANTQRRLMEAAGFRIADVRELPISTLSFDSAARGVANSGADYLFFIGDANSNVSMARAMADTGYRLRFAEYFTFAYGTDFIGAAGAASEGATTWLRTIPNEEASGNEEMATFLEWMDQSASDAVRDVFSADSWAGAKAFFDALEALPGPITRAGLVAQLRSVDSYDAAGMLGPIRLGAELSNACVIGMRVESGQWRRMAPTSGFLCS